jgi:hypothetical protein
MAKIKSARTHTHTHRHKQTHTHTHTLTMNMCGHRNSCAHLPVAVYLCLPVCVKQSIDTEASPDNTARHGQRLIS